MIDHATSEIHLLQNYLLIGGLLFAIGLVGFLTRRNMIGMFLAAELMPQAVSVALGGWGRFHNHWGRPRLAPLPPPLAACPLSPGTPLSPRSALAHGPLAAFSLFCGIGMGQETEGRTVRPPG